MDERKIDYKRYEGDRIISVSDLFEEILRKIWLVIVLAVAFAVIFAGYKYMSDKSKAEESTGTVSHEEAGVSLTDEETREVDNILRMYDEAEATEQYLNESILMQIDPYHEYRLVMQYTLEADDANLAPIMQLLGNYVGDVPMATDLQEYYPDVDTSSLLELITFEWESSFLDQSAIEDVSSLSNVFIVRVNHVDEASCQELADNVQQCISNYLKSISGHFGSCSCTLLKEYGAQIYDSALESTQKSTVSDQITLQNKINTQTEALNDEQLKVLDAALAGGDDIDTSLEASVNTDTTIKVHINKKYLALGLIIGIVLGVVLIALFYVFRGTLDTAQELQAGFNIPVFGQIHVKKQKNPLVKLWRRIINKKKAFTVELEQQVAFINLKNFCKTYQIDKILLAGSQQDILENVWMEGLQEVLHAAKIEVGFTEGLPDSPEALEKLSMYSYITLVETLHESIYADVVRELEVCMEQKIQVIGAIVLD